MKRSLQAALIVGGLASVALGGMRLTPSQGDVFDHGDGEASGAEYFATSALGVHFFTIVAGSTEFHFQWDPNDQRYEESPPGPLWINITAPGTDGFDMDFTSNGVIEFGHLNQTS